MNQSIALVFGAAILALGLATHAQVGGGEKATAGELFEQVFPPQGPMNRQRLSNLTTNERESVKAYLRGAVEKLRREGEGDDSGATGWKILCLAAFGDEWAMEMVVKQFWNARSKDSTRLRIVGQPKTIAMIGEGLFMEEERYHYSDVVIEPTQIHIARGVLVY